MHLCINTTPIEGLAYIELMVITYKQRKVQSIDDNVKVNGKMINIIFDYNKIEQL